MGVSPSIHQPHRTGHRPRSEERLQLGRMRHGGYTQSAPAITFETLAPFIAADGNSSIIGLDVLVDAQTAALVNGIASHTDDYDDTHRDTPIHPSGPVLSALLAVAEWKAPVCGPDFVTAFVAGVEAECKLGLSVYPEHYDVGWRKFPRSGACIQKDY